jgi:hypothetical protein
MSLKAQIEPGRRQGRAIPAPLEREPPNEMVYGSRGGRTWEGSEAIRVFVQDCAKNGASSSFCCPASALPGASLQTLYTEEEVRAAGEQARESNVWLTGRTRRWL